MSEELLEAVSFESCDLSSSIKRAVREMGFESMTPIQAQAIPALLTGKDIIGQAQTGTGKTAAFGLPILQKIDPDLKEVQAIILCPTRELAMQAADELRNFAKYMHDVRVLPVYGGQDILRQIKGLKGVQIVVGTPGRVMDHMRRHTLKLDHVSMVVLDEADEMLNMGFREDMEVILGAIEHPHQTCLFSATMPEEILRLTHLYQKDPQLIRVTKKELTIDTIRQYYYPIRFEYKTLALLRLLAYYHYKRCIIFCNTKSMVDELAAELQKEGYAAEGLHGDLTQKQRDFVMGRFRSGSLNILLATDIAARGIDVDDVEAVFNYDLPSELEYYVHRIGRTGRAGREGVSHSLCRGRDLRRIHEIEVICHATMEERRVPTAAQILEEKQQEVLNSVMSVMLEGHSGSLIPVIRNYCKAQGVSTEEFAAAFLKRELGDVMEELVVDLPPRGEGRPDGEGRGRRRSGDGRRRSDDREPANRAERRKAEFHHREEQPHWFERVTGRNGSEEHRDDRGENRRSRRETADDRGEDRRTRRRSEKTGDDENFSEKRFGRSFSAEERRRLERMKGNDRNRRAESSRKTERPGKRRKG